MCYTVIGTTVVPPLFCLLDIPGVSGAANASPLARSLLQLPGDLRYSLLDPLVEPCAFLELIHRAIPFYRAYPFPYSSEVPARHFPCSVCRKVITPFSKNCLIGWGNMFLSSHVALKHSHPDWRVCTYSFSVSPPFSHNKKIPFRSIHSA